MVDVIGLGRGESRREEEERRSAVRIVLVQTEKQSGELFVKTEILRSSGKMPGHSLERHTRAACRIRPGLGIFAENVPHGRKHAVYAASKCPFEQDGRGCFWTDGEKGRPFRYEMDSAYSCQVAFDDGGKAAFGLYADQGGALPRISEEGSLWLALSLDGGTLWFY